MIHFSYFSGKITIFRMTDRLICFGYFFPSKSDLWFMFSTCFDSFGFVLRISWFCFCGFLKKNFAAYETFCWLVGSLISYIGSDFEN